MKVITARLSIICLYLLINVSAVNHFRGTLSTISEHPEDIETRQIQQLAQSDVEAGNVWTDSTEGHVSTVNTLDNQADIEMGEVISSAANNAPDNHVQKKDCLICLGEINDVQVKAPENEYSCKHFNEIHDTCHTEYTRTHHKTTCPKCRATLSLPESVISDTQGRSANDQRDSLPIRRRYEYSRRTRYTATAAALGTLLGVAGLFTTLIVSTLG